SFPKKSIKEKVDTLNVKSNEEIPENNTMEKRIKDLKEENKSSQGRSDLEQETPSHNARMKKCNRNEVNGNNYTRRQKFEIKMWGKLLKRKNKKN
ncbi:6341_t:CDS:1, partial [Funneliformis geosporum]